jgi:hypothetical protein
MENLSLFAQAIWKCGWFTGFWVSVLIVYAAEAWAKHRRVPTPYRPAKVVSIEKAKPCRQWRRA